jgi:nucleoside-diphosphate-sugar epimerase
MIGTSTLQAPRKQTVAITGSNGFIGNILMRKLSRESYHCVGFDRFDGPFYRLLTTRYLQPLPLSELNSKKAKVAKKLWSIQRKIVSRLIARNIIRPKDVNILDFQNRWIKRFKGFDAVIHLAAIPHPGFPGRRPMDFEIVNYWGAVNIFESAVAAGVKRFIFSSSAQVYDINNYRDWIKFPVHEAAADRIQETRTTHPYSSLKWKFERYLVERSAPEEITSIALRLEFPGIFGGAHGNLWAQTSVENLVEAFDKSLQAGIPAGGYKCNICNEEVPRQLGKIDELVRQYWPNIPNECVDNQALLDLSEARKWLNYNPKQNGSYYLAETVF